MQIEFFELRHTELSQRFEYQTKLEVSARSDCRTPFCSDFRYESNGIFVLGVGFFFLQTNFDFLTSHF